MNLLFLAHRIPFPPNKGDKIRSYHELRYLAARHRVHLGCLVDRRDDLVHVPQLRKLVASLAAVPLDPRAARLRGLAALARREPLSVGWFRSRRLAEWVRSTVARERIDAVFLFSSPMFAYAERLGLPVVMDFCDVDSDKWRQYAERAPRPLRPLYALEARRLRAYEEHVLQRADAATLVAEREQRLWAGLAPALQAKVHIVPNGVDLEFFAPRGADHAPQDPDAIVFTGAMDYYANVDAVVHFTREVLPRVRATMPQAHFLIVGSNPTAEVQALGKRTDTTVTGFVTDVRGYYARAAVCVVPLRIARGIQNKLLEAMAMGRAVVASPEAADGLRAGVASAIRVAADPDAMAAEIVAILQSRARAAELGRLAREYVEREYDWDRPMRALEELLEQAAGPAADAPVESPVAAPSPVNA